jgi:hypothetical protein
MLMFRASATGRFPDGLVKGDPNSSRSVKKKVHNCSFTKLYPKDVRSITWFDKHNLICVGEVEWLLVIRSDREVKCGGVNLRYCRELAGGEVELSNQFPPPETELRVADIASRNKYWAVIDRNRYHSLGTAEWVAPERRRGKIVDKMSVLDIVSMLGNKWYRNWKDTHGLPVQSPWQRCV